MECDFLATENLSASFSKGNSASTVTGQGSFFMAQKEQQGQATIYSLTPSEHILQLTVKGRVILACEYAVTK